MSEFRQLPNKITPVSVSDLHNALLVRAEEIGRSPSRFSIEAILAHIFVECGVKNGVIASCHNYNLGNYKQPFASKTPRHWQYFACGEEVPLSQLKGVEALCPGTVTVKAQYQKDGGQWVSLWILPHPGWTPQQGLVDPSQRVHPWTRFAAFEDLFAGLQRKIDYLASHPEARDALFTNDIAKYNDALYHYGYYTASRGGYLAGLQAQLRVARELTKNLPWGDVI